MTDAGGDVPDRGTLVALSGGESRRMGRDKAFVEVGGREMLDRLLEVGRAACSACVLVVNDPGPYAEALARWGWREAPADAGRWRRGGVELRLVTDRRPGLGPVAGLEAGLSAAPTALAFAAACDLPFLDAGTVRAVLRALEDHRAGAAEPGLCAVVPVAGGRAQPLAAAYASGAAGEAGRCVDGGDLRVDDFLARLDVRRVDAGALAGRTSGGSGDDPARPFLNVNGPDELRAARRRAGTARTGGRERGGAP